jgi:hypothetical protein
VRCFGSEAEREVSGAAEEEEEEGGVSAAAAASPSPSLPLSARSSSGEGDGADASDRSEGFLARGTVTRSLGGGGSSEELDEEAVGEPLWVATGLSVPSSSLPSLSQRRAFPSSSSSSSPFSSPFVFPGVSGRRAAMEADEARLAAELTARTTSQEEAKGEEGEGSRFGSGVLGGRRRGAALVPAAAACGGAAATLAGGGSFSPPTLGGVASTRGVSDPEAAVAQGAGKSTATARLFFLCVCVWGGGES